MALTLVYLFSEIEITSINHKCLNPNALLSAPPTSLNGHQNLIGVIYCPFHNYVTEPHMW
jgi:hypothetical protein